MWILGGFIEFISMIEMDVTGNGSYGTVTRMFRRVLGSLSGGMILMRTVSGLFRINRGVWWING